MRRLRRAAGWRRRGAVRLRSPGLECRTRGCWGAATNGGCCVGGILSGARAGGTAQVRGTRRAPRRSALRSRRAGVYWAGGCRGALRRFGRGLSVARLRDGAGGMQASAWRVTPVLRGTQGTAVQ
ncbi:hypothetical protein SLA2020_446130 [Shorea laevis]